MDFNKAILVPSGSQIPTFLVRDNSPRGRFKAGVYLTERAIDKLLVQQQFIPSSNTPHQIKMARRNLADAINSLYVETTRIVSTPTNFVDRAVSSLFRNLAYAISQKDPLFSMSREVLRLAIKLEKASGNEKSVAELVDLAARLAIDCKKKAYEAHLTNKWADAMQALDGQAAISLCWHTSQYAARTKPGCMLEQKSAKMLEIKFKVYLLSNRNTALDYLHSFPKNVRNSVGRVVTKLQKDYPQQSNLDDAHIRRFRRILTRPETPKEP